MRKTKTQKGITLIALIITIVVLMILAVVTINAVKDGGIIQHAQDAADKYETEKEREEKLLKDYEADILISMGKSAIGVSKYLLGEDEKGRNLLEIVDINEETGMITFKDDPNTKEDETKTLGLQLFGMIEDETGSKILMYAKSGNEAYKVTVDPTNTTSEKVEKIYSPQGNEGKKVKYDSNNDGKKEEWTVLTDRDGKLEIVSNTIMGQKFALGISDPFVTTTEDLNGDGIEGNHIDQAIASYNNLIKTLNEYCQTQVTATDNSGVRSIGASIDEDISGAYSSTNFDSWFKGTGDIKSGDTYFEEDFAKMSGLGILNIGEDYYIASRFVSEGDWITFEIREIDDGFLTSNILWLIKSPTETSHNLFGDAGVRPVVINPTNIEYID